jgi:flagellar protein FliL
MVEEARPTAQSAKDEQRPGLTAGGSRLVPVLTLLNSLILAGVLGVLLLRPGAAGPAKAAASSDEHGEATAPADGGEHGRPGKKEEKSPDAGKGEKRASVAGPTVRLPDFIVHLRDADADRYARVTFEIEVKEERGTEALNARLPQIRDAFLAYLSDRTVEELRGSEAMAQLKEALANRLHEIAPGAPVRALYVTDLVVQ